MDLLRTIARCVEESLRVKERFFNDNASRIKEVAFLIASVFEAGGRLFLFGNGGSATDASHIAAEFVNRFQRERAALPALALTTDMAVVTSISNDYDFSEIFARQLESLSQRGDAVIAISTSGRSQNVLRALDVAKDRELHRIAFTGQEGLLMAEKADHAFVVPSADTPIIQETHIMLGHLLCHLVEEILFEKEL